MHLSVKGGIISESISSLLLKRKRRGIKFITLSQGEKEQKTRLLICRFVSVEKSRGNPTLAYAFFVIFF
jgi:hypothetical protein